ncbi:MAG: MFS transporter [Anaerolineae bacterium]
MIISSAMGSGIFLGAVQLLNPLFALRLGYRPTEIGALSAAAALAYSVASLGGGALAARLGIRRMMLVGILITAAGMALGPLAMLTPGAGQFPMLIASQLLANLGWAMKQVSLIASLAGATTPATRTGAYAVHEASCGAAALAGALIGGALPALIAGILGVTTADARPYALVIGTAAAISVLAIVPALRVAPPAAVRPGTAARRGKLRLDLALLLVIACGIGTTAGQGAAKTFASVYLDTTYSLPTSLIGTFVSVGLGASVIGALASGRLARRMSNGQIMLVGSAAIAGGLLLLGLGTGVPGAMLGIVLVYGVLGLWRPAFQGAQMEIAAPESRAAVSGISAMGMSIGYGFMAYGGGAIAAGAGYPAVFLTGAAVTLLAAILSGVLSHRMAGRPPPEEEPPGAVGPEEV